MPQEGKKKANCNDFISSIQSWLIVHEKVSLRNMMIGLIAGREKEKKTF